MLEHASADANGAQSRRLGEQEAKLQYDAMHDSLTGLPNRSLFLDRLRLTLARLQRRPERTFAVLFLCLDRFKATSESIGPASSDALLQEMTKRLYECLRPEDTVARLEGDEFAIMIDELKDRHDIFPVADRIQTVMQKPMIFDGLPVEISGSIGIAVVTSDYQRADDVVQAATLAMEMAKMSGGAQYALAPSTAGSNATIQPCLASERTHQPA